MAQLIKPIEIDCSRPNRFQTTVSKQGDINSRFLRVSLADNGNPIEITSENTVIVNYKRGDGEINSFSGTVNEDGTVTIPLTSWLLDVSGNADCEIVIYDSTEQSRLSTTLFTLYVEPFITDDSEVTEDSKYDILLTLITQVDTAVNACNTATEAAQQATMATEKAITDAEEATEATNAAIEAATTATENANAAIERANAAAEVIENIKAEDIPFDPTVTGKTAIQNTQQALDALLLNSAISGGAKNISSWVDVQKLVRLGLASAVFNIGDQIVTKWYTDEGEEATMTWDIIGIDVDTPADSQYTHSLTLQAHDVMTKVAFNPPEALFVNRGENEIPAGTFNFTVDDTVYRFTLTNAIPAGGCLVLPLSSATAAINSVELYEDIFTDGAVNAVEVVTVTAGSGGTALSTLGAVNTNKQRMYGGGQRWKESVMRAYLNTDGDYIAKDTLGEFTRLCGDLAEMTPFYTNMDEDLIEAIGEVTKRTAVPEIDGGGTDLTNDKLFLLAATEVNGSGYETEGAAYPYYDGAGNAERKKQYQGSNYAWRLRSCNSSNAYTVRNVTTGGNIHSTTARGETGVAPACCIV